MTAQVFWPTLLGLAFLAAGLVRYRGDFQSVDSSDGPGLAALRALGPAFVASALAAFAGEHFTAATGIATLIPKWMPARVFIAYFVGVAHLAAALSFVARRYVRWSSISLAVMFGLFVLLMDLPAAIARPSSMLGWTLAARQATFAIGALALFATETRARSPESSSTIATIARLWMAGVLILYGVQHVIHPELAPGVPSPVRTASWVPLPMVLSYLTGLLLIAFGSAMLARRYAGGAAALGGLWMLLLTLGLYVPQFFLAANAQQQVVAINFVFDTLLFAGTVLVIGGAIADDGRMRVAETRSAQPL